VHAPYLVVCVGVAEEVTEEPEARALPDQDEVGGPVGQVGRRGEAPRAPGARAAHGGGVHRQELPAHHMPLPATSCGGDERWIRHSQTSE